MKQEGQIRVSIADGRSVLIPFSRYMKMSEEELDYIYAGMTGRYPTLPENALDIDDVAFDTTETDEVEVDDDIDLDCLYLDDE